MSSPIKLRDELAFPSDYVGAADLKGRDVTVTIANVVIDDLQMKGGITKRKPILQFKESPKKLVVNKTNATTIAELYGNEMAEWVGKRITIYPTKTKFGRKEEDCVRVRPRVPEAKQQQTTEQEQH